MRHVSSVPHEGKTLDLFRLSDRALKKDYGWL
jgi:hypothetical protein